MEAARQPAGLADAGGDMGGEVVEMDVAGRHLALGAGDADEGALEILVGEPHCVQEGAVRRPVHSLHHDARAQFPGHVPPKTPPGLM